MISSVGVGVKLRIGVVYFLVIIIMGTNQFYTSAMINAYKEATSVKIISIHYYTVSINPPEFWHIF